MASVIIIDEFFIDVKNVNESQDGDGACGSSSSDLSKKQQQLYLTAKTDLDAKNIIGVARAGPSASRLINNNPKVVMAIEDCQGAAEGHKLVGGYDADIIFFKGDYKIGFYAMDIKAPPNLKVDQSEEFLKNVKPNGDSITEKSWDGLTDIVRTISYE